MIKYLLISDNANPAKKFPEYLAGAGFIEVVEVGEGKENHLQMPDVVVLATAHPTEKELEKTKKNWPQSIIIVFSKEKLLAWKAYELGIEDFILLPASEKRMLGSIAKIKELFFQKMCRLESSDEQFFFIREKETLKKLKISDVTLIQAMGDYINIFTASKRFTVHLNLKHVIKRLPSRKFTRVHRSYIVNIDKIEKIFQNSIYLNAHHVPIGDAFKKELNSRLNIIK